MSLDLSAPQTAKVYSVSELNAGVRRTLESQYGQVCVEGEVSNHRLQASGHQYFSLKDEKSQISCVWFAGRSSGARAVPLADGMQVQVRGLLTVFEARGNYQISVQSVQAAGAGLLQARFEALKRRLQEEGLFDRARKRPLPRFPKVVGLVTSPTGSVVQDMLKVMGRRAPWVRVLVFPVRVQGPSTGAEVAEALAFLNRESARALPELDVLIVGRGGGSVEDLWGFNEEVVARAIHASRIPVVSAVGHETDFTIADFVADVRAPTPSAAAELVVPDGIALSHQIHTQGERMASLVASRMRRLRQHVDFLERSALFREPRTRLAQAAQRVDVVGEALQKAALERLSRMVRRVEHLNASVRAHRPDQVLALRRQQTEALAARMERALAIRLRERHASVEALRQKLVLLSPEGTLERGYSITLSSEGNLVRGLEGIQAGQRLYTRLRDGKVESVVVGAEASPQT